MAKKQNSDLTIAQIIRKRRAGYLIAQSYRSLLLRCAGLILALYLLMSHVFLLTQVQGNGMFPALEDGDLVFAFRIAEQYNKNDVVVYTQDGKTRIGRIAARETDVIMMDDTGMLKVNGTHQGGEILYPTYPKEGTEYPFVVPDGQLYILGDYRTQCEDSRDFGTIPLDAVQGKVITILRRRGI